MIPRLSSRAKRKDGRGQSFKTLSAYLFNGSLDQPDPARAPWAHTLNCHASDPSQAWAEMAWTYRHADELKQAAGGRLGGQKNNHPVWHLSLNWKESETPTRDHMIETAQSVLRHFGLQDHQALIVNHTDTAHSHIHIMVNTVNPHDGRSVDVSKNSKARLSAWALDYERMHGIQCEQRVENDKKRTDNRNMHALWETMAQTNPQLGAPKLAATYDKSDSRPLWQLKQLAKDLGLSKEGLDQLVGQFKDAWHTLFKKERAASVEASPARPDGIAPARAANDTPRASNDPADILVRLTHSQSTFDLADIAKAVNLSTNTRDEFISAYQRVLASPELVKADADSRYSTKTMIRTEAEMAQAADAMATGRAHALSTTAGFLVKATHLSSDQKTALDHITKAEGLACVVGYAGTGKSTMLGAARELWEASGYTVRGFALSGIAAEGLQGGSGIQSTTLASLKWHLDHDRAKLGAKDILVIDEAGMVASRQMHMLLTAAATAGAKVVLVGDPAQLQAIEAGGAFKAIIDRAGAAEMTTVRRQQADWQQDATKALARGEVQAALEAYRAQGHVKQHQTDTDAMGALVAEWAQGLGKTTPGLMLAVANKDVAAMNQAARTAMRAAGLLGEDTKIKARDEGIGKPTRDFHLRIAEGELLLFTKNDKTLGVKNGTLGTLVAIKDGSLTVQLDGQDKRRVSVDLSTYRNITHGYALTIHKAQGVTVDRAHVLATRSMDRHAAYVSLSRHREKVTMHYSAEQARDLTSLSARLSRDRTKGTTLDHFKQPSRTLQQSRADKIERANLGTMLSHQVSKAERTRPSAQFQMSKGPMKLPPARDYGRERER